MEIQNVRFDNDLIKFERKAIEHKKKLIKIAVKIIYSLINFFASANRLKHSEEARISIFLGRELKTHPRLWVIRGSQLALSGVKSSAHLKRNRLN